jgi:hypothetical protein
MSAQACAGWDVTDVFMDAPTYSTTDAAALCGLPFAMLHRWAAAGVITSTVPANGSGTRRVWSPVDIDQLQRIGDVYREASARGLLVTWQAVHEMWQAMTDGTPWRVVLAA